MSGEEAANLLLWSDLDDDDEEEDDRRVQHSCNCSDNEENRRMIMMIRELMLQNDIVVDNKPSRGMEMIVVRLSCEGGLLAKTACIFIF